MQSKAIACGTSNHANGSKENANRQNDPLMLSVKCDKDERHDCHTHPGIESASQTAKKDAAKINLFDKGL